MWPVRDETYIALTALSLLSALCAACMLIGFWRERHTPNLSIASHAIFWLFICNLGLGIALAVFFFPIAESSAACVVSAAFVDFFALASCMWTCVLVWLNVAEVFEANGAWIREKLKVVHFVLWLTATLAIAVPLAQASYCPDMRYLHVGTRPPMNAWVFVPLSSCYMSSFVAIVILIKYRWLSSSQPRFRLWVLVFIATWLIPLMRDGSLLVSRRIPAALRDAHRYNLAVMGIASTICWVLLRPKVVVPQWGQVFDMALHIDPRHPSFDSRTRF